MASPNIYEQEKGLSLLNPQNYPEGIQEYMALEEAFLASNLREAKTVLEIGCGNGRYLEILAPIVGEILGIDYAEYLVNVARSRTKNLSNVNVINGNAKDLPSLLSKTYQAAILAWNTIGNMPQEIHSSVLSGLSQYVEDKIFISTYQCSDFVMEERLKLYKNCGYKVDRINGNQVIMENGEHTAYAYPIDYFRDLMMSHNFSMETYELGLCGVMIVGSKTD